MRTARPPAGGLAVASLDWIDDDPDALRRAYAAARRTPLRPTDRWHACGAAPVRRVLLHRPRVRRGRCRALVYFHGGGWVVGSPVTHATIARALADASGLDVHSVDYRLMPGHSSSAPLRDGLAVLRHLLRTGPYERLALAGDSAGAAIALAVARFLENRQRHRILAVVGFYGAYGLERSETIGALGRRCDGLDEAALAAMYGRLTRLGGPHPYRIPLLAGRRLPPTHLFVGSRDPLSTDSHALHAALSAGRTPVRISLVAGEAHGYLHDLGRSDAASRTLSQAARLVAGRPRAL